MNTESGKMWFLPARSGTCAMCATKHNPSHAHNLQSVFYCMRFKAKWGRDPTWADACAHLTEDERRDWKAAMRETSAEWTEPPDGSESIREPYAD